MAPCPGSSHRVHRGGSRSFTCLRAYTSITCSTASTAAAWRTAICGAARSAERGTQAARHQAVIECRCGAAVAAWCCAGCRSSTPQ